MSVRAIYRKLLWDSPSAEQSSRQPSYNRTLYWSHYYSTAVTHCLILLLISFPESKTARLASERPGIEPALSNVSDASPLLNCYSKCLFNSDSSTDPSRWAQNSAFCQKNMKNYLYVYALRGDKTSILPFLIFYRIVRNWVTADKFYWQLVIISGLLLN